MGCGIHMALLEEPMFIEILWVLSIMVVYHMVFQSFVFILVPEIAG